MKTLLVLAAGPLQLPAITTARRMGLRVVAADGNPTAPGLALADTGVVMDITDPAAGIELATREKVDGVIQICSESAMHVLGAINEHLALPGPRTATVRRATNKQAMRQAFEAAHAPSPQSIPVSSREAALAAMQTLRNGAIAKPVRNSGSRGITCLPPDAPPETVIAAFERALAHSSEPLILIEQFVAGQECSVEALAWKGHIEIVAITDKITTGAPYFVESGHSQPTQACATDTARIRAATFAGIQALGLDNCAVHAEIKFDTDAAYIIEIGARLGGDFITTELVPRSTGIDMVAAAIQVCLGEEPDLSSAHPPRGAAIRYLTPPPGIVSRIDGVDRARQMPGVEIVDIYVKPAGQVACMDSSLARSGHVIAEGETAKEAVARAEVAREAVEIVSCEL